MLGLRCDQTVVWGQLAKHYGEVFRAGRFDTRLDFRVDPARFSNMWIEAPGGIIGDLSKNLWTRATLELLDDLALACELPQQRDAMVAGEPVNHRGERMLHMALRAPRGTAPYSDQVHATLDRMLAFAEQVRNVEATGIRHVVNIGIGGSAMGPRMGVAALAAFAHPEIEFHWVTNGDRHAIDAVLRRLPRPQEVLFIVASKSFTTFETLSNAEIARQWLIRHGVEDIDRHFVATTANAEAAKPKEAANHKEAAEFGCRTIFAFEDWVIGRFAMWGPIGLPLAIAIGEPAFRELLAGAHEMDRHFLTTRPRRNLPMMLGLLDLWYRNFHATETQCVVPYHDALGELPDHLRQMAMETLGKCVDRHGELLPFQTSPVWWGQAATDVQHGVAQMLHQGTTIVPVDLIGVGLPSHGDVERHQWLLDNLVVRSEALMHGRFLPLPTLGVQWNPGCRPSTTLLMPQLTPRSLGALNALYEHRIVTTGLLWGVDMPSQWGGMFPNMLRDGQLPRSPEVRDPSTAAQLRWKNALRASSSGA